MQTEEPPSIVTGVFLQGVVAFPADISGDFVGFFLFVALQFLEVCLKLFFLQSPVDFFIFCGFYKFVAPLAFVLVCVRDYFRLRRHAGIKSLLIVDGTTKAGDAQLRILHSCKTADFTLHLFTQHALVCFLHAADAFSLCELFLLLQLVVLLELEQFLQTEAESLHYPVSLSIY